MIKKHDPKTVQCGTWALDVDNKINEIIEELNEVKRRCRDNPEDKF